MATQKELLKLLNITPEQLKALFSFNTNTSFNSTATQTINSSNTKQAKNNEEIFDKTKQTNEDDDTFLKQSQMLLQKHRNDAAACTSSQPLNDSTTDDNLLESLIVEVQACPCIWKVPSTEYKLGTKRKQAWLDISKKLGHDVNYLKIKWKGLKDNYEKCLNQQRDLTISGVGSSNARLCNFFHKLSFIEDTIINHPTSGNIQLEPLLTTSSSQAHSTLLPTETSNIHFDATPTPTPPNKRKKNSCSSNSSNSDETDKLLLKVASNISNRPAKETLFSADQMWCLSLAEDLQKLKNKQKIKAKLKIMQVMLEFTED